MVLALDGLPRFAAARDDGEARAMSGRQFRIGPTMEYMERGYDSAKFGELHDHSMMWGLTPTVVDPSLAPPGRHIVRVNPAPELADYRTPIAGLYHCGAGTWPGGTISGLPGHNASHRVLADLKLGHDRVSAQIEQRFAAAS